MKTVPADHELLISGEETVAELRAMIAQIALQCPLGRVHERCPFNMFGLLDPTVRAHLIEGMSIEACQHFFELERECRADANCAHKKPVTG